MTAPTTTVASSCSCAAHPSVPASRCLPHHHAGHACQDAARAVAHSPGPTLAQPEPGRGAAQNKTYKKHKESNLGG